MPNWEQGKRSTQMVSGKCFFTNENCMTHASFKAFLSVASVFHILETCFLQRDPDLEAQALDWIEANLGEPVDRKAPYEDVLKDGIILCK